MSQANWSYCNPQGHIYRIGLYHGQESGHVLIYCNQRILTIDFEVIHTKSYTFYLDQDECEVMIEGDAPSFTYDLRVNDERASQLVPPKKENWEDQHIFYFSILGILCLALLFGVIHWFT